ncbi:MAG: carboxyltransferase domain-containing protein [Quisquiliibacterium sp.]
MYTLESPGGWNLIGRTPLSLFAAHNDPPAVLRPGDHVRFMPITRERFDELEQQAKGQA